jgi:hypothetical protein
MSRHKLLLVSLAAADVEMAKDIIGFKSTVTDVEMAKDVIGFKSRV